MTHYFLTTLAAILGPTLGFPGSAVPRPYFPPPSIWERIQETHGDTVPVRWVLIPEESEARYRVREQLAGFDFPNDAVGSTRSVTGALVVEPDGTVDSARSEFRVQLSALTTDNERRDRFVQGRTLEVGQYPEAVLVPLGFMDIPLPLPESGTVSFRLEANLSLHGETRPTIWEVEATFSADAITGLATTSFPFNTFGIIVPQVARVLSVEDNIRLELDFRMVRDGAS